MNFFLRKIFLQEVFLRKCFFFQFFFKYIKYLNNQVKFICGGNRQILPQQIKDFKVFKDLLKKILKKIPKLFPKKFFFKVSTGFCFG